MWPTCTTTSFNASFNMAFSTLLGNPPNKMPFFLSREQRCRPPASCSARGGATAWLPRAGSCHLSFPVLLAPAFNHSLSSSPLDPEALGPSIPESSREKEDTGLVLTSFHTAGLHKPISSVLSHLPLVHLPPASKLCSATSMPSPTPSHLHGLHLFIKSPF